MKNYIIIALIAFISTAVIGCRHTAHGIGEDMEDAGEAIQRKVN